MLCSNCRNENTEGSKFCRYCGTPLLSIVQTTPPVQESAPVKETPPVQESAPVKETPPVQQPPVQQPMQGNPPPQWNPQMQGRPPMQGNPPPQWNPQMQGGYMPQPAKQKKEKGKGGKIALIAVIAAVLVLGGVIGGIFGARAAAYSKAEKLFEEGQYEQAAEAFEKMGDYKDAPERAAEAAERAAEAARQSAYAEGEAQIAAGDYAAAEQSFAAAKPYSDSTQMELFARALDCDDRGDGAGAYAIVEAEDFTADMTPEHADMAREFRARILEDYEWEINAAAVENGTVDWDTADYFYDQYCQTLSQDAYSYLLRGLHSITSATCCEYETGLTVNGNFYEGYFNSNREFYEALTDAGFSDLAQDQCYDSLRLQGSWKGDVAFFTMDEEGYIDYNMPAEDFGEYYDIYDHIMYFFNEDASGEIQERKDIFEITFESDDCITFYCFKGGQTYTLYRVG